MKGRTIILLASSLLFTATVATASPVGKAGEPPDMATKLNKADVIVYDVPAYELSVRQFDIAPVLVAEPAHELNVTRFQMIASKSPVKIPVPAGHVWRDVGWRVQHRI